MKSIRIFGGLTALLILLLTTQNASGQSSIIERDEARFVSTCTENIEDCAYSRIWVESKQIYTRVDHIVFHLGVDRWRTLLANESTFWSLTFPCESASSLSASAYISANRTTRHPVNFARSADSGVCTASIRSADVKRSIGPGDSVLVIRSALSKVRPLSEVVNGDVAVVQGVKTRIVITNDDSRPLILDGVAVDGGLYRGLVSGGTIIDVAPSSIVSGNRLYYSGFIGWEDFAKSYGLKEAVYARESISAGAPSPNNVLSESKQARVMRAIETVREKLVYRYQSLNGGPYPTRAVADIYKSGYADCKDYSLALGVELEKLGVESKSVITSLNSSQPPSLLAPSYSWANHVLVWIPSMNLFVDMTADRGREIVQSTSAAYGSLGFEVGAGSALIIR